MPHAEMKASRRAKRELHQRTPLGGRRASSAASSSKLAGGITAESSSISAPLPALAPATKGSWRNPADLPFIARTGPAGEWNDMAILRFLRTNAAFSIPPRPVSTADPWVVVSLRGSDGEGEGERAVRLPRGYRVPLLWVAMFLWRSAAHFLSGSNSASEREREEEWDEAKWDILHAARLCHSLLSAAQGEGEGMDRGWRHPPFDRALRRYWHRWLVSRDEFVRDFWQEFGEEEYTEGDVLKLGWGAWVLKGHAGFALTRGEVVSGISADEFAGGLRVDEERGTFGWVEQSVEAPPVVAPMVERAESPRTGGLASLISYTLTPTELKPETRPHFVPEVNPNDDTVQDQHAQPAIVSSIHPSLSQDDIEHMHDLFEDEKVVEDQETPSPDPDVDMLHVEYHADPMVARDSSTEQNRGHDEGGGAGEASTVRREEEEESEEGSEDAHERGMQGVEPARDGDGEQDEDAFGFEDTEDDLDLDLELFYPDHEEPAHSPARAGSRTPASSASDSTDVDSSIIEPPAGADLLVFPPPQKHHGTPLPLSTAAFPMPMSTYPPTTPTTPTARPQTVELAVEPQLTPSTLIAQLTALGAEVGALRGVLAMEERVRRLEGGGAGARKSCNTTTTTSESGQMGMGMGMGSRLRHPLQHLISGVDSEDEDVDVGMGGEEGGRG